MNSAKPSFAVLGSGSWGTALASLIARNGHPTTIWGRDAAQVEAIARTHENPRYLPGIALPDSLRATTDLATALHGADLVLVVVPSHAFAETLRVARQARPWVDSGLQHGWQDPLGQALIGELAWRLQAAEAILQRAAEAVDRAGDDDGEHLAVGLQGQRGGGEGIGVGRAVRQRQHETLAWFGEVFLEIERHAACCYVRVKSRRQL